MSIKKAMSALAIFACSICSAVAMEQEYPENRNPATVRKLIDESNSTNMVYSQISLSNAEIIKMIEEISSEQIKKGCDKPTKIGDSIFQNCVKVELAKLHEKKEIEYITNMTNSQAVTK